MQQQITRNIDAEEVQKFSSIASRWWDTSGEFRPLHEINPLRLNYIMDCADGLFDKNVIDVGCGGGILSESMAKAGAKVTGIDASKEALQVAKLHGLESGIKVDYHYSTAEDFAQQNAEAFDVVTCLEMLEHVPQPEKVIEACSQLCKPGGLVFFSTLNKNIKAYLMAIVGAEYIMNIVPKGTHDFEKFIKPSVLLRAAEKVGLKAKSITGLHLNPLSNAYYLSDKNVDVNYIVCCEKLA